MAGEGDGLFQFGFKAGLQSLHPHQGGHPLEFGSEVAVLRFQGLFQREPTRVQLMLNVAFSRFSNRIMTGWAAP